jgi:hypothetical protein
VASINQFMARHKEIEDRLAGYVPDFGALDVMRGEPIEWTCNGFVPVTYLIMPPWLRTRVG